MAASSAPCLPGGRRAASTPAGMGSAQHRRCHCLPQRTSRRSRTPGARSDPSRPTYGRSRTARSISTSRLQPRGTAPPFKAVSPLRSLPSNQELVGCEYLEDAVECLSQSLLEKCQTFNPMGSRYIVGITGPPGGGKSTLSEKVRDRINDLALAQGADSPPAVVVPMDGFHFYRTELDAMDDPEEAHARRGAHWTFNAEAFADCLKRLAREGQGSVPSFDHAVGDPIEDDILVTTSQPIILVEGNYLLLDLEPWDSLAEVFNETWYVDTPVDDAMERIFKRQTTIGLEPDESLTRINSNDRPNALLVATTKSRASLVIPTLPLRAKKDS